MLRIGALPCSSVLCPDPCSSLLTSSSQFNSPPVSSPLFTQWSDSAKLEDSQDRFVVDMVLDKTGNKGTGKMTCKEACETGVPAPSIAEALFARFVAADYDARQETAEAFAQAEASLADKEAAGGSAAASLDSDFPRVNREQVLSDLERALYAAKICSYAQGLNIIRTAAQDHGWEVDLGECARIWTGGCIVSCVCCLLSRVRGVGVGGGVGVRDNGGGGAEMDAETKRMVTESQTIRQSPTR